MNHDLKKHSTIIIAWDASGKVEYCRTYDYVNDKDACQAAYTFVSQNYPMYVMSEVGHYLHQNNFKPEHV